RGEPPVRPGLRSGLGEQAGLAVGAVAGPQLIEPTPGPPGFPASLDRAHLASSHPVQHSLAHACETPRGSHGHLLPVDCLVNGRSITRAPLLVMEAIELSGFNVGTTG